ncbi:RNA polymerase sigma factor [Alicyclobacillus macrosporangiidus]|uniref:RNA polymerase sigma-70 factor, ECF subfamily n=1 Tax=Alicyclobacillus macrosporangiidus TaxID=392015 RepID=A0A1I7HDV7_9BACL|nr:sigma-70 family RNA polymerase sigma factor [Alicyclobacillus macrosporangiidus]SFU58918.1 RNA polymerase sigma-70 factor, ECF subfamily [Alicyclobacillus macrosporangiidus]
MDGPKTDTRPEDIQDVHGFSRFAEAVVPRALRLAARWTGDVQLAEDLVQEALTRTWQTRHRIRTSPEAWMLRILWRLFLNERRRSRPEDLPWDVHGGAAAQGIPQERALDRMWIGELLALLPERDRQLLAMRYGEDLTVQQIAAITGMREGTVKARLSRALRRLREMGEGAGGPSAAGRWGCGETDGG